MATKLIKDIFVGDIGTIFRAEMQNFENAEPETILDISSATEKKMVFIKPDGTEVEFDAIFSTDGVDGLLQYTTSAATDLSIEGKWAYYPWIKYPNGQRRGSEIKFTVYPGRQSEQV